MNSIVMFFLGLGAGCFIGIVITSCLAIAHDSEIKREQEYQELLNRSRQERRR